MKALIFINIITNPPRAGVPSAPGQVVVTRNTKSSVYVQWEPPKHLKHLMGYYIDGRVAGSKEWFPCNHKPFKHSRSVLRTHTVSESAEPDRVQLPAPFWHPLIQMNCVSGSWSTA